MVCFSPSIEQRKQVYNYKTNDVGVVFNEHTNQVKAAELSLANS